MRVLARLLLAALLFSVYQGAGADGQVLTFARRVYFDAPFAGSVVDIDGDGRLEVPGLLDRGDSYWSAPPSTWGLAGLVAPNLNPLTQPFPFIRLARDLRVADLDDDGRLDVVSNVYSCNGDGANATELYMQRSDGTFARNMAFDLLPAIRGHGETIVAADFDNDGYLDLYIPQYTRVDASPDNAGQCAPFLPNAAPAQSWLLMNRGAVAPGTFTPVTGTPVDLTVTDCGIDCTNAGSPLDRYAQPEGAQAIDYDEDGNIDLLVAGMLFRNSGAAGFSRVWPARGVNPQFDEGLKFFDWNNDGYPDFVTVNSYTGVVHLFAWKGGIRDASGTIVSGSPVEVTDPVVVSDFARYATSGTYGVNVADVNGDGYEDVIVNGSVNGSLVSIYLNQGPPTYAFKRATTIGLTGLGSGRGGPVAADLNYDGMADVVLSGRFGNRSTFVFYNLTPRPPTQTLMIEVLGVVGARTVQNQQGRVVHVTPTAAPAGFSYTRYVDGGSGYMTQGPYPISMATSYSGAHAVSVRLAATTVTCVVVPPAYLVIRSDANPGCSIRPLPPPLPIPRGHEIRALQGILESVME